MTTASKTQPTLYGFSRTGKTKQWTISSQLDFHGVATNTIVHGYIDGKKQTDVQIIVGKNIGKSNETTSYDQAVKEAVALWQKKLDKGYGLDSLAPPKYAEMDYPLPMLAHDYKKRGHDLVWPCYAQPKLDGIRCVAAKRNGLVTMWSRAGKVFDTMPEIQTELDLLLEEGDFVDGEIYVHGWSFQRITRAVKKRRDQPDDDDTLNLRYHIYDRPDLEASFEDRYVKDPLMDRIRAQGVRLCDVQTWTLVDQSYLDGSESDWIGQGYEGIILRGGTDPYKWKHRSTTLLKVKRFQDDEFLIVGGKEGTGRATGQVTFTCVTDTGAQFDARPKGTDQQRQDWWTSLDKFIGCKLKVKYQGFSDEGIPRFPVGLGIREAWDQ